MIESLTKEEVEINLASYRRSKGITIELEDLRDRYLKFKIKLKEPEGDTNKWI
jgi:hypothetical protein